MFYLEEKSYQEIAEIIGTNPKQHWGALKELKND
jgi:DNA-directed RNA polymerase specialized sigma24 family protein